MKYAKQFLAAAILLLALSCGKNNKTAIADDEIASAFVDVKTKGWLEIPVDDDGDEGQILRRKGYTDRKSVV